MQKQLMQCFKTIEEIAETSSGNEKIAILKNAKGSEIEDTLKKVLECSYHPKTTYNMGKTRLKGVLNLPITSTEPKFKDIFHLLDFLNSQSGLTDEDIQDVYDFFSYEPLGELRELYTRMILKDLRAGITDKTVNKVWEGFIPQFKLQLAKKYENRIKYLKDEEIAITSKLDGIRCATTISKTGEIEMWTRQYKAIKGLQDIEIEIAGLLYLPANVLLDGELLYNGKEELTSAERYRKTVEIVNSDDIRKENVTYHVFDIVNLDEFKLGKTTVEYKVRSGALDDIFADQDKNSVVVRVPILYLGNDHSKIYELLDEAIENNEEGVMINLVNAPYECKRTNNLLKVKKMHTVDLKVLDVLEGEGKYQGQLGSIAVQYKDYTVKVGSGFSDEQRVLYWNNKDLIKGKIVEVQYFEESSNKDGELSLRFPIFKGVRLDKDEESYE